MKRLKSLLVGMFACLFGAAALYGQEVNQSRAATKGALPSLAAIKACNSLPDSAECLDKLFRDALKEHTTLETLQLIQRYEKDDAELRRDCHPAVHRSPVGQRRRPIRIPPRVRINPTTVLWQ